MPGTVFTKLSCLMSPLFMIVSELSLRVKPRKPAQPQTIYSVRAYMRTTCTCTVICRLGSRSFVPAPSRALGRGRAACRVRCPVAPRPHGVRAGRRTCRRRTRRAARSSTCRRRRRAGVRRGTVRRLRTPGGASVTHVKVFTSPDLINTIEQRPSVPTSYQRPV